MATFLSPELYRPLFEAAIALRDLKPWQVMGDAEYVTVRDPETSELGLCSVMGGGGQTFGVAIYRGRLGLANWERTLELASDFQDPSDDFWSTFLYNSFGLFFVSPDELEPQDKKLYKALGLKFRGKNNYVQLRNMEPGFIPDLQFTAPQLAFFTHCVEQTLEVARRLMGVPEAGTPPDLYSGDYFVRHPTKTVQGVTWEDRYETPPELSVMDIVPKLNINNQLLVETRNKFASKSKGKIAYLILPLPSVINEGPRPYVPLVCLTIDEKTGMAGSPQVFSYLGFLENFSETFIEQLTGNGQLPKKLVVIDEITQLMLKPICEPLGIKVIAEPDNEELSMLIDFMFFQSMLGGEI